MKVLFFVLKSSSLSNVLIYWISTPAGEFKEGIFHGVCKRRVWPNGEVRRKDH
jgi:hypothetical protein